MTADPGGVPPGTPEPAAAGQRRGRLKVFFGASPGVGKTYAMLDAARRARAEGVDVVIGWIDTHGRVETEALAQGFERIALRAQGAGEPAELDLDAALARRAHLVLLDDLAHTNGPGARHRRRWQDARELLEAGIDVFATLEVQHLESLRDVVKEITGVTVNETVPDHVLDEADEVELVDVPPEDLVKRFEARRQGEPARSGVLPRGSLMALRELALRSTADRVDAAIQEYRRHHAVERTWPVAERILICIRPHPESPRLIRAAQRMAKSLRAAWIVVSVESTAQPRLSPVERESLTGALKLADDLGAETAVLSGDDVSQTLLAYARRRNVTKIVVGKPAHPRWRDRLKGSLADAIVRGSGGIDVYFIAGEGGEGSPLKRAAFRPRSPARSYLAALAVVGVSTLLCGGMFGRFESSNLVMTYLLGVAFVAVRYGRGPSALATVLSVGAFDLLFVPPYRSFAVADGQYAVTFVVMLVVGLLIGTLAVRVRDQAEASARREQRTQLLYSLSRELAGVHRSPEIASITSGHVVEFFGGSAAVLLPDASGLLQPASPDPSVERWVFEQGRPAGRGTDTFSAADSLYVPLRTGERTLGVLALQPSADRLPLSPESFTLMEALARQAAASLERVRLRTENEQAMLAAESERLRSTLLSSVSHDFRTPLAAITGAITTLRESGAVEASVRGDLEETIQEEAERLNRLITNLLDMTRLDSGRLPLRRDWHSIEEVVGSALRRVERRLGQRPVSTRLERDLPLVQIDAGLIEQALVNLLENAIRYTPPGCRIRIEAARREHEVLVTVADDGPGLLPGEEERVFEKFHRAGHFTSGGFGLGLPICRAVISMHGGRIWAENQRPHGAVFHFSLPGGNPMLPAEGTPA